MRNNISWRDSSIKGAWATLMVLATIIILSLIVVWINNWEWADHFSKYWLVFPIILLFTFVFTTLLIKIPLRLNAYFLTISAVIFMLAALKDHPIGSAIRTYIDDTFNVAYLSTGITLLALAVAFATIYSSRKQSNDDQTTS